jgi:hypothetical protein
MSGSHGPRRKWHCERLQGQCVPLGQLSSGSAPLFRPTRHTLRSVSALDPPCPSTSRWMVRGALLPPPSPLPGPRWHPAAHSLRRLSPSCSAASAFSSAQARSTRLPRGLRTDSRKFLPTDHTTPLRTPPERDAARITIAMMPRAVTLLSVRAVTRHREVMGFGGKKASIASDSFVAPSANVVGDVTIGPRSAVWYGAVVLGKICPPSPSLPGHKPRCNPGPEPRRRKEESQK